MKRAAAFMMAFMMALPGNAIVFAEENVHTEAEAAGQAAEEEARRAAEEEAARQAAEEAARRAAEEEAARQAAEEAARRAAEEEAARQAEEAARKAAEEEAARQAEEAARKAAEEEAARQAEEEAAKKAAEEEAARKAAEEEAARQAEEEAAKKAAEEEAARQAEETTENYRMDFQFKNNEVTIEVEVSKKAELPENTKMKVTELQEGSKKYEQAKAASMEDLGTDMNGKYHFYELTFMVDGKEIQVENEQVKVKVHFRDPVTAIQIADGIAKKI